MAPLPSRDSREPLLCSRPGLRSLSIFLTMRSMHGDCQSLRLKLCSAAAVWNPNIHSRILSKGRGSHRMNSLKCSGLHLALSLPPVIELQDLRWSKDIMRHRSLVIEREQACEAFAKGQEATTEGFWTGLDLRLKPPAGLEGATGLDLGRRSTCSEAYILPRARQPATTEEIAFRVLCCANKPPVWAEAQRLEVMRKFKLRSEGLQR